MQLRSSLICPPTSVLPLIQNIIHPLIYQKQAILPPPPAPSNLTLLTLLTQLPFCPPPRIPAIPPQKLNLNLLLQAQTFPTLPHIHRLDLCCKRRFTGRKVVRGDEVRPRTVCADEVTEVIWAIGCGAAGPCRVAKGVVFVGLRAGGVEAGGCVGVAAGRCVSACLVVEYRR